MNYIQFIKVAELMANRTAMTYNICFMVIWQNKEA